MGHEMQEANSDSQSLQMEGKVEYSWQQTGIRHQLMGKLRCYSLMATYPVSIDDVNSQQVAFETNRFHACVSAS